MSIIKRKKQDKFFIMSNHATQQNLTSLNSIGLLAYIKSLPEDFTIYKTFLQKKFTRRTVDSAWGELVEKEYIAGFSCYIDRKKQYFYLINDEPLTVDDFNEFVEDTLNDIKEKGTEAKNLQPIKDCNFSVAQFVQHSKNTDNSSVVRLVQHKEYSTSSTVPNVPIQINTNKDIEQINNNKEINNVNIVDSYIDILNSLFLKLGEGLFNRKDILFFINKVLEEMTSKPSDPELYFTSIVEMIVYRRKKKLGMIKTETPFYNWLEN